MSTLSVALIVKNNENTLEKALKNLHIFADEIVVVDTGSTDSTKAIARKYTDKIFELEWGDDFSKVRNYALSKCTKEYRMMIGYRVKKTPLQRFYWGFSRKLGMFKFIQGHTQLASFEATVSDRADGNFVQGHSGSIEDR